MTVLRAGLYVRVSTEEQALRGYSVEAQIDALDAYCAQQRIKVIDHYIDAGVSGGKPSFKRPQMSRLLQDVRDGNIDIILFTRLDRWFRNVPEYFKVQEILDAHRVEWKAVHEDYDTASSNGRMAITIFLAIAQNEREKNADRVRAVLQNKRRKREACFGGHTAPWGYRKQRDEAGIMRLVKDPETESAVTAFWDYLVAYQSQNGAARYMAEQYGIRKTPNNWHDIIHTDFYSGVHRGVPDFCPAYVSPSEWARLQPPRVKCHATQGGRVYLFSGLIRCPVCGQKLCATYTTKQSRNGTAVEYYSYRCRNRIATNCTWRGAISERKAERYLLANLDVLLRNELSRAEMAAAASKPKPKYNVPALRDQLRRLEVVYMAGNKSDADYLREQAEINALIAKAEREAPPAPRDVSPFKQLLETDFRALYQSLDRLNRRRFWRSLIKRIEVEGNAIVTVVFL